MSQNKMPNPVPPSSPGRPACLWKSVRETAQSFRLWDTGNIEGQIRTEITEIPSLSHCECWLDPWAKWLVKPLLSLTVNVDLTHEPNGWSSLFSLSLWMLTWPMSQMAGQASSLSHCECWLHPWAKWLVKPLLSLTVNVDLTHEPNGWSSLFSLSLWMLTWRMSQMAGQASSLSHCECWLDPWAKWLVKPLPSLTVNVDLTHEPNGWSSLFSLSLWMLTWPMSQMAGQASSLSHCECWLDAWAKWLVKPLLSLTVNVDLTHEPNGWSSLFSLSLWMLTWRMSQMAGQASSLSHCECWLDPWAKWLVKPLLSLTVNVDLTHEPNGWSSLFSLSLWMLTWRISQMAGQASSFSHCECWLDPWAKWLVKPLLSLTVNVDLTHEPNGWSSLFSLSLWMLTWRMSQMAGQASSFSHCECWLDPWAKWLVKPLLSLTVNVDLTHEPNGWSSLFLLSLWMLTWRMSQMAGQASSLSHCECWLDAWAKWLVKPLLSLTVNVDLIHEPNGWSSLFSLSLWMLTWPKSQMAGQASSLSHCECWLDPWAKWLVKPLLSLTVNVDLTHEPNGWSSLFLLSLWMLTWSMSQMAGQASSLSHCECWLDAGAKWLVKPLPSLTVNVDLTHEPNGWSSLFSLSLWMLTWPMSQMAGQASSFSHCECWLDPWAKWLVKPLLSLTVNVDLTHEPNGWSSLISLSLWMLTWRMSQMAGQASSLSHCECWLDPWAKWLVKPLLSLTVNVDFTHEPNGWSSLFLLSLWMLTWRMSQMAGQASSLSHCECWLDAWDKWLVKPLLSLTVNVDLTHEPNGWSSLFSLSLWMLTWPMSQMAGQASSLSHCECWLHPWAKWLVKPLPSLTVNVDLIHEPNGWSSLFSLSLWMLTWPMSQMAGQASSLSHCECWLGAWAKWLVKPLPSLTVNVDLTHEPNGWSSLISLSLWMLTWRMSQMAGQASSLSHCECWLDPWAKWLVKPLLSLTVNVDLTHEPNGWSSLSSLSLWMLTWRMSQMAGQASSLSHCECWLDAWAKWLVKPLL